MKHHRIRKINRMFDICPNRLSMRTILFLLAIIFLLGSCSSSKKISNETQPAEVSELSSQQNGSSYERAIVINKTKTGDGIKAEYEWIRKNYPGYKLKSQSLQTRGKKVYDVLTIITADGKKKEIYFDISNFFGKY